MLVLDEPTSSLTASDTERLFEVIAKLAKNQPPTKIQRREPRHSPTQVAASTAPATARYASESGAASSRSMPCVAEL